MSLFQCSKCGCLENTSLTGCSHSTLTHNNDLRSLEALMSYKDLLGMKPEEEFLGEPAATILQEVRAALAATIQELDELVQERNLQATSVEKVGTRNEN